MLSFSFHMYRNHMTMQHASARRRDLVCMYHLCRFFDVDSLLHDLSVS